MVDLHWLNFGWTPPSITGKATVSSRTGTCRKRKASTGSWGGQRAAGEGSGLSRAGDKRRHFIRYAVGQRHASCGLSACQAAGRASGRAIGSDAMAAANLRHADAWLLRLLHRPFLLATEATGGSTAGPLLAISSDTYTAQLAAALNRTRALG